MNALNIDKHILKLKSKNINYTPIGDWNGFNINIDYKCNSCNEIRSISPSFILTNPTCLKCKSIKKRNEYISKIKNTTYILIDENYKHCKYKCLHKCKKCGIERLITPMTSSEIKIFTEKCGCPNCNNQKVGPNAISHDDYVLKLKDFKFEVIEKYINASTSILHRCFSCNKTYKIIPNNILIGQGCLYCSGNNKKTTEEYINDIKSINKKVIPIEDYINRKSKIKHLCLKCNSVFIATPLNVLCSGNDGCPNCISSNGENYTKNILIRNKILFEKQKTFETCKNERTLPFDFYLPELDICIEYDGVQHFKPNEFFGGKEEFEKRLYLDGIKNDWCKLNNKKLIRIPYYLSNDDIEKIITLECV